jgi:hypothetical protein
MLIIMYYPLFLWCWTVLHYMALLAAAEQTRLLTFQSDLLHSFYLVLFWAYLWGLIIYGWFKLVGLCTPHWMFVVDLEKAAAYWMEWRARVVSTRRWSGRFVLVALTRHERSRSQLARAHSFLMRFSLVYCSGSTYCGAPFAHLLYSAG